jgi:hypothetical protein
LGFHKVTLAGLCDTQHSAFDECYWDGDVRGIPVAALAGGWVTSIHWNEAQWIDFGLVSNCNACVYDAAEWVVSYDLTRGGWQHFRSESLPHVLPEDGEYIPKQLEVIGPDPNGRNRTLAYRADAECTLPPQPRTEYDEEFAPYASPMVASGLFNTASFACIFEPGKLPIALRHRGRVSSMRWSPDGLYVLTGSYDGAARIFDAETGEERRSFVIDESASPLLQAVWAAEWSPDQKHVLLLGPAGMVIRPSLSAPVVEDLRRREAIVRIASTEMVLEGGAER